GTWQTETTLMPPDPTPNGNFGWSIALGPDLLVTSFLSVYTFERQGSSWHEVDEIPSVTPVDQIGLSGDTLVVGNTIYVRSGSGWQVQTTLQADNDGEFFEGAAIDGDRLVVTTTGTGLETPHTVYFYSRSGDTWTREGSVALANALAPVHLSISGSTAL